MIDRKLDIQSLNLLYVWNSSSWMFVNSSWKEKKQKWRMTRESTEKAYVYE